MGTNKKTLKALQKKQSIESEAAMKDIPQSMVFRRGKVGPQLGELVEDLRQVMSPYTAQALKESKKNSLRDFVAVASPLGVTHFLILSQTPVGSNLRLVRLPHGPTLTFRLNSFSNIRDIVQMQKTPHSPGSEYKHPPLLVLNNFSAAALMAAQEAAAQEDAAVLAEEAAARAANPTATLVPPTAETLKLTATMLQNMFPPLDVARLVVKDCRRVVILHYEPRTSQVLLRHYLITAAPCGLSKSVRKLLKSQVPDLSNLQDISEMINKPAYTQGLSDSEAEDAADAKITLPQAYHGRGNRAASKSAIRLHELGPRADMQLLKISEEMDGGKVLYHYRSTLTAKEVAEMEKRAKARKDEKARRRAEQARNVERKAAAKGGVAGKKRTRDGDDDDDDEAEAPESDPRQVVNAGASAASASAAAATMADAAEEEDDDVAWYRREVGQEPQEGLFDKKDKEKADRDFPMKAERRAEEKARKREEQEASGEAEEQRQQKRAGSHKKQPVKKQRVEERKQQMAQQGQNRSAPVEKPTKQQDGKAGGNGFRRGGAAGGAGGRGGRGGRGGKGGRH